MREIKFRAWSELRGMCLVKGLEFIKNLISTPTDDGNFWVDSFDDMHLMQYTGLKDKNGKEIYDGDIMRNSPARWEIVFNKGCFCHKCLGYYDERDNYTIVKSQPEIHLALRALRGAEIIGNIYENPELIKHAKGD